MSASVHSLPEELLCAIFLHLAFCFPCSERSDGGFELGWVASATHVCHKWREAALEFPELWAQNVCALPSAAATDCFLGRAQSMPLVFRVIRIDDGGVRYTVDMTDHQVMIAAQNLDRVQAFDVGEHVRNYYHFPSTFIEALAKCALSLPHLTFLRLHRWDGLERGKALVDLTLDAPALRELHLNSVFFSHINAPQMRVLAVKNEFASLAKRVPRLLLLDTLKSMPLLEQLTIGSIMETNTQYIKEGVQVELTHLRRLRLQRFHSDFDFHSHIRFADTASVEIHYTNWDSIAPLETVFNAMGQHLRAPVYDVLTVHGEEFERGRFSVHLYSSASACTPNPDEIDPHFGLNMSMDWYYDATTSQVVNSLMPHINAERIRFLDYSLTGDNWSRGNGTDTEMVRATLALFAGVTTVQLSAEDSIMSVSALRAFNGGHSREQTEEDEENGGQGVGIEPPLPVLQHLIVRCSETTAEEFWSVVVAILQERKNSGRPLRFLTLAGWCVHVARNDGYSLPDYGACDAQDIRRAEELVEKVFDRRHETSWDGRGSIFEYMQKL